MVKTKTTLEDLAPKFSRYLRAKNIETQLLPYIPREGMSAVGEKDFVVVMERLPGRNFIGELGYGLILGRLIYVDFHGSKNIVYEGTIPDYSHPSTNDKVMLQYANKERKDAHEIPFP